MIQYLTLGDQVKGQEKWNSERQSQVRIERRDTKMARGRFQGKNNKEAIVHLFRQNTGRGKLKIQVYWVNALLRLEKPSTHSPSFEVNDQPSSCMEGIWPTPHFHCSNPKRGVPRHLLPTIHLTLHPRKKPSLNDGAKRLSMPATYSFFLTWTYDGN
jgi:hypothetical protein